jgi:hypothetical protein
MPASAGFFFPVFDELTVEQIFKFSIVIYRSINVIF